MVYWVWTWAFRSMMSACLEVVGVEDFHDRVRVQDKKTVAVQSHYFPLKNKTLGYM